MTGCKWIFSSYTPSSENQRVKIVDGSLSVIAGIGKIVISTTITLTRVLHGPKLSYNLLSISKITKDLNCVVNFSQSTCVFQDLISGRKIGSAKEYEGLYYFEKDILVKGQAQTVSCNSLSRKQEVLLWHCRLGHPSFPYLQHLFPSLFENKDFFQCEVCQVAKHKQASFPSQNYKASTPFALIHSNVWGPFQIHGISNKRWFVTFIDDHIRICWVYLLKEKSEVEKTF